MKSRGPAVEIAGHHGALKCIQVGYIQHAGRQMDFQHSERSTMWLNKVREFLAAHSAELANCEAQHGTASARAIIRSLRAEARHQGLWNLFMPPQHADDKPAFVFESPYLTNIEYAPIAEELGRTSHASEIFNCSAPDTGNMELLLRYGSDEQKTRWLGPLMRGEIRSAFLMTEPDVASSDATNIATTIIKEGDEYRLNGRKWWASGVGSPDCRFAIVVGRSDPLAAPFLQQSMIVVPTDTSGFTVLRMLDVFGYDHAPGGHGEVMLGDVRVPAENLLLRVGAGFEMAQGRLGPGRIHHCMRLIGAAEAALDKMIKRLESRRAFGRPLADHSIWDQRIGDARIEIEMTRLLCLKAADTMDRLGNKSARTQISMIKVAAPRMALRVIDDAIQAHGGGGVSSDFGLADAYARARTMRIADGPDEVHWRVLARSERKRVAADIPALTSNNAL
jgi:acyl-CoA dehydrogenase